MSWSPTQYSSFETERTRPVRDLVQAIPATEIGRAIDLGCGPGNSTEVLAARFPHADISGVDSSAEMIDAARTRLPARRFVLDTVETWDPAETFDIILSNAALQWVPNHATLMPRLMGKLALGGNLAVQMPDNLQEPAHRRMRQVAASGPWAEKLSGASGARAERQDAEWYFRLLRPHAARVDVWRTTYHHVLDGGTDAVVAWFRGSGLRPFLAPLDPSETEAYLAEYRTLLAEDYPLLPDGTVLLPFPRLFIIATR